MICHLKIYADIAGIQGSLLIVPKQVDLNTKLIWSKPKGFYIFAQSYDTTEYFLMKILLPNYFKMLLCNSISCSEVDGKIRSSSAIDHWDYNNRKRKIDFCKTNFMSCDMRNRIGSYRWNWINYAMMTKVSKKKNNSKDTPIRGISLIMSNDNTILTLALSFLDLFY